MKKCHPRKGGPWYGVVHASKVMYRVHMVRSLHDQTLFRLSNTDVWYEFLKFSFFSSMISLWEPMKSYMIS